MIGRLIAFNFCIALIFMSGCDITGKQKLSDVIFSGHYDIVDTIKIEDTNTVLIIKDVDAIESLLSAFTKERIQGGKRLYSFQIYVILRNGKKIERPFTYSTGSGTIMIEMSGGYSEDYRFGRLVPGLSPNLDKGFGFLLSNERGVAVIDNGKITITKEGNP